METIQRATSFPGLFLEGKSPGNEVVQREIDNFLIFMVWNGKDSPTDGSGMAKY